MVELGHPGGKGHILVAAYAGGWGSGKSTLLKWLAMDYATMFEGIRILVCRKTLVSLELTTQQEFTDRMVEGNRATPDEGSNLSDVFREDWNQKNKLWKHVNGSSVLFGGLDKASKWGSSEFGLVLVEEASEISRSDLSILKSRLRQRPPECKTCSGAGCAGCEGTGHRWGSKYSRALLLFLNHCQRSHWIYEDFLGSETVPAKAEYRLAETSSYENAPQNGGFLPSGYLESLEATEEASTVSVFMGGRWGSMPKGIPVYPFTPGVGVGGTHPWQERPTQWVEGKPLHLSFDFGYRFPAVLIHQIQSWGRWRVLAEFTVEKSQTADLLRALLGYLADRFPGFELAKTVYGDPAGWSQRSEGTSDALTVQRILGVSFRSLPSTKDSKVKRRKLLAARMKETIGDEPAFAIDSDRCPVLSEALRGLYRFPDLKATFERENYVEEPVEEHPYVDFVHSLEYFALNHFRGEVAASKVEQIGAIATPGYRIR